MFVMSLGLAFSIDELIVNFDILLGTGLPLYIYKFSCDILRQLLSLRIFKAILNYYFFFLTFHLLEG
ncbi:hypothetical protein IOMTU157_1397 [Citrobacter portucalensis]|nr:hypothetical protein IOMTU157_1397 [Citrobacter portucalensis]